MYVGFIDGRFDSIRFSIQFNSIRFDFRFNSIPSTEQKAISVLNCGIAILSVLSSDTVIGYT